MKSVRSYIIFIFNLFAIFSFCSCSGKDKNTDELGSTAFYDCAPRLTEEGMAQVYTNKDVAYLDGKAVSLPVEANYFAIFNDKLYYIDTEVRFETGNIPEGKCKLLCYDLDGQAGGGETVFEWQDIVAMGRLMI